MASRMEKYYHNNTDVPSRTKKNANLYDELYDNVKYSNVEGIANIASSNEIDITKIKKLINEHENDKDTAFVRKTVNIDDKKEDLFEEKNYDLKEVLNDAKKNRPKDEKERYIQEIKSSNFLEKLNELNSSDVKMEDLTNVAQLSSLGDDELSLDLLGDLKSNDNTFIGELSERVKKEEPEEVDQSFYTNSMNFSKEDFEELDGINKNIKKNNVWITILVFIILVIVITGGLFLFDFLF